MASSTVRVKGLRETVRAFGKLEKTVQKEVKDELKKAAEPVAETARTKVSRYAGSKPQQIRPRVGGSSVFVRQHARKVTGQRGDFGALQTRRLEEALDERQDDVVNKLEDTLDALTRSEGF